jgi:hypothetical protein
MLDTCQPVSDSMGKEVYRVCATGCSDTMPCPANNSCYKASTGSFCRPFVSELPGGECNLSGQLGCDKKPGTACAPVEAADKSLTTGCIQRTGKLPIGAACTMGSECENGSTCAIGVCRHYCDASKKRSDGTTFGCAAGEQCAALSSGDAAQPNVCLKSCSFQQG